VRLASGAVPGYVLEESYVSTTLLADEQFNHLVAQLASGHLAVKSLQLANAS
jgi:hypothetical protein